MTEQTPKRKRYVPAVGPRLKRLLAVVFGLFALLGVNSAYLSTVTLAEWATGEVYQNWFYLIMFVLHLLLGVAIVGPVVVFGIIHMRNAKDRRNRRAVRVGYALFTVALVLLGTGIVLTRLEGVVELRDPAARRVAYWLHVIAPLLAAWLFVLHRLAGKKIRWKVGLTWAAVAGAFAIVMLLIQAQDPRQWNVEGNPDGEAYFFPSLARTFTGDFIPAETLMNDAYCEECHADIHAGWSDSVHRFSSFNNPVYLFSVRETRAFSMERDGNVNRARFCAGCHDPVPFFSGQFNDPNYDDVNDPTAHAGITCTACHAINHVNSVRGNADYTIDAPIHYPFASSDRRSLRWLNRQLVKAKPAFHKKTFLKPLHQSTEFCGTCHKVHLPEELNDYKWLRGQNHYDPFLLSGVSGVGVSSFYYPPRAQENCNGCHMPLVASADFGARVRDASDDLKVHGHLFPSANTAMPGLVGSPRAAEIVAAHRAFNEDVMRVDLFGLRRDGRIDGELLAPLRPEHPVLEPGGHYLLDVVIRTMKMGHVFTQGTADSNEVWLELTLTHGDDVIGRSGWLDDDGAVDPWSHFVNSFVVDREGRRIERRDPQNIFTALYTHQIPPGAADTLHYAFTVPPDLTGAVEVRARLLYRKFDTTLMRHVMGSDYRNDLPVMVLATDQVTLMVGAGNPSGRVSGDTPDFPEWMRWNDYGIGLLRKSGRGELRQAEQAFARVEALGRPDGPLNRARVYIAEGRVAHDAPEALRSAAAFDPPPPPWSLLWFGGLVNRQNANFDEAIDAFRQIVAGGFPGARERGFDFSRDYRVLNTLGLTLYERAKQERGDTRRPQRETLLADATAQFRRVLELDPENVTAHWNLSLILRDLGEPDRAAEHAALHAKYKPDDNARDRAIAAARQRYPAANHAAEAVVIYDLQRPEGSFALHIDGVEVGDGRHAVTDEPKPSRRGAEPEDLVHEDDAVIGRAFRRSLFVIGTIVVIVATVLWLRTRSSESVVETPVEAVPVADLDQRVETMPRVTFVDVTRDSGVSFVHESAARGLKLLPETMGSGVAFVDYDGDGDQDLLFANGTPWPDTARGGASSGSPLLYRNEGRGNFTDVTASAGLGLNMYGTGIAAADFDGDGDVDLFLTALGRNRLMRNDQGVFADVTESAGVAGAATDWSTSAGFFDYDGDGDLDLFVCNYVQWSREIDLAVNFSMNGRDRAYGPPTDYAGSHPALFRNEGGGRFTDVSAAAGVQVVNPVTGDPMAKALALTFVDVDRDGFLDVFVANDTVQNFLFHNRGDGTFEEVGALAGVGFDAAGNATGAMGIDAGHHRNDDQLAVGIANFANEMSSLYVSNSTSAGSLLFTDEAAGEGVGAPSRRFLSFGLFFFDYDLDGRLDLLQANGHLEEEIHQVQASQRYRQRAQLFWNRGAGARSCFAEVPAESLGDLNREIVGRGAAYGDVDGDGDLDVVLTQTAGAPLLLRNDQSLGRHWLRVRLIGPPGNRDAIGAWVEVELDGSLQRRQVMPTRSYLSQVELPLTFGLGDRERVDRLRVYWPGGATIDHEVASVDTTVVIRAESAP